MDDKFRSRKWVITKTVLWFTNLICLAILVFTAVLGQEPFLEVVPAVLAALGGVNAVAVGAYNYSNMRSKEYES